MIIAEAPRFPQLGTLFFSTLTQPGLAMMTELLHEADQQHLIGDVDIDAVTHVLLGGLLTSRLPSLVPLESAAACPPSLDHADAVVEIVMRALAPRPGDGGRTPDLLLRRTSWCVIVSASSTRM